MSNNPLIPAAGIGAIAPALYDDFFDKVDYAGALVPGASPSEEWITVDPDDSL